MDGGDRIVTESRDRTRGEATIEDALRRCGYPEWAFGRIRNKERPVNDEGKSGTKSRGMVVLPYKEGLSRRAY